MTFLPECVHDRAVLERLLRADSATDAALHAYELGDLDDFFWPHTTWYRHGDSVALVYHGAGTPILLALARPERAQAMAELVDGLASLLPQRFYVHVSAGAESALSKHFRLEPYGLHYKMVLTEPERLEDFAPAGEVLTDEDLTDLSRLYLSGYPGNSFDPRMLQTGQYVGVKRDGRLVAVAGVHVWSPVQRVAALGNVVTDPAVRGQGLGTAVVGAACRRMLPAVDIIALNVKADNASAIAVYTRLGFTHVADYWEFDAFAATGSGQAR
jgi:RimJ/RimL family protein N-acetyltransferase